MLPEGSESTEDIELVFRVLCGADWPEQALWLAAIREVDAKRVVFGRDDESNVTVAKAVAASCAIPMLFRPVEIGDHRHIDGGAHSLHNLDLLVDSEVDLVIVRAPMSTTTRSGRLQVDYTYRRFCRRELYGELVELHSNDKRTVVFEPRRYRSEITPRREPPGTRSSRGRAIRRGFRRASQPIRRLPP